MRAFRAFLVKEFRHIVRDRRTLLILFGIPLVQLLLFGFALRTEIQDIRMGISDASRDALSAELIAHLDANPYFRISLLPYDPAAWEEGFRTGALHQVLVIPPTFAERVERDGFASLRLLLDSTDPNASLTREAYTRGVVMQVIRPSGVHLPPRFSIEPQFRFNPQQKSVYLFVPGLMGFVMILISALLSSVAFARETESGTLETLLVSPLHPIALILGKLIPYFVLSFLVLLSILGMAVGVFNVPVKGSLALLLAVSGLFLIVALAFGLFLSTRVRTQQAAMLGSMMGLLLPALLLSGFIFPIESMPMPLQGLSHLNPAKWYVSIARAIMLKGAGWADVAHETRILGGMAAVLMAAAWAGFRQRLD